MKKPHPDNSNQEIKQSLHDLRRVQKRLQELSRDQADAFIDPSGELLLPASMQKQLIGSDVAQKHQINILQDTLDALPAHIALLDNQGMILLVNESWKRFGSTNGLNAPDFGVGMNYLKTCLKSLGECREQAIQVHDGIQSVIESRVDQFSLEYPCHSPNEKRWFRIMVTPRKRLSSSEKVSVVVMHIDITERKMAEVALLKSEEKHRKAQAIAGLGWYDWNLKTMKLVWSDETYRLFGISKDRFGGTYEDHARYVHPDDSEWLDRQAEDFIESKRTNLELSYRIVRPDGAVRWLQATSEKYFDDRGKLSGITGTLLNVTEMMESLIRSKSTQALLHNAERLANMGSWETHIESKTLQWSDQTYKLFGIRRDQFNNTLSAFYERVHPLDRIKVREAMKAADQEGGVFEVHYRILRPDGEERLMFQRGETILDEKGLPVRRVGMVMDVTEEKRRESDIREKTELLQIAGESARIGGWSVRLADKSIRWSDQVCDIHEVERGTRPSFEEAIQFYPEDHRKKIMEAFQKCMQEGIAYDLELDIITAKGNRRNVRATGHAEKDSNGDITAVQGAFQDLTEKKNAERRHLRSQRMESIGTLAGGIAHDLNNILAPVIMSCDLIETTSDDPELLKMTDVIRRSAMRGAELIKQLLSFARGLEGKRVLINLRHITKEIEKIMGQTFPKNIQLSVQSSKDLWNIQGDPTQIHQILINLCVNARDAMPEGGLLTLKLKNLEVDQVFASMNPEAKPGNYVMVEVNDTGTGIRPEDMDKIFEPFFTTKEQGKGTGMGLSTSLGIVQSHGGFINVYSELNQGTTFKIYLPADVSGQPLIGQEHTEDKELPVGKGELLLVIDDEPNIRHLAETTLTRQGYRVLLATNGSEAISLYAKHVHEIALVITDMNMPVMDGPTTILALRGIKPDVKVIGCSGLDSQGGMGKKHKIAYHAFLAKPYNARPLLETIRDVLAS